MLDVLTIFFMIIVVSMALGLAIAVTAKGEPDSGLAPVSVAMLLHGTAYILLIASHWVGPVAVWVAELCFALVFAATLSAYATFYGIRTPPSIFGLIILPVAAFSAAFHNDLSQRILFNTPVLVAAVVGALVLAWTKRRVTAGRGKYLVIASGFITAAALIYRGYLAAAGLTSVHAVLDADLGQTLIYLSSLTGLVFLAIGFVMMTKERADQRNLELILKDKLTGIWNRRKIEEVGVSELKRHLRYGVPVTLLLLDLDDFKPINDHFGHSAGDRAISAVTKACSAMLRETDTFGRWGGEEFAVILPDTGVEAALAIAENLRQAVAGIVDDSGLRLTVSIGVSLCLSTDDWPSWFDRVDAALYRAKAAGKNRVHCDLPLRSMAGYAQIPWSETFVTGIADVDAEHVAIVVMANDLLRLLHEDHDRRQVLEQLNQIERITAEHFISEEAAISELQPARLADHRLQHEAIVKRLAFLKARFRAGALPLESFVQFVVFEVCGQHMAIDDRKVFEDTDDGAGVEPEVMSLRRA